MRPHIKARRKDSGRDDSRWMPRRKISSRRGISFLVALAVTAAWLGYARDLFWKQDGSLRHWNLLVLSSVSWSYSSILTNQDAAASALAGNTLDSRTSERVAFVTSLRHNDMTTPFATVNATTTPPSWAIFYNVYIPRHPVNATENAMRIVREQVQQLLTSPQAQAVAREGKRTIFVVFVTMGLETALTQPMLDELCPLPLKCRLAMHLEEGTEADTLEYLHEYCQQQQQAMVRSSDTSSSSPHLVTYLHNKGSYQRIPYNENWRNALTRAAIGSDCQDHVARSDCNVCGLQFFQQWTPFFPGNMFTTECQYVNQLMDIREYGAKLNELAGEAMIRKVRQEFVMTRHSKEQADFYGLDRFYAEHWIGSHPDIVPCDVGPLPFSTYGNQDTTTSQFQWSLAPRSDTFQTTIFANPYFDRQIRERRELRLREFFGTAGQVYRWLFVYGRVPPDSSWVWDNYDDGKLWRNAIAEHGVNAVAAIASEWSAVDNQPAFRDNYKPDIASSPSLHVEQEPRHAVFFKAHVPAGADHSALQPEVELINNQLDLLDRHFSSPNDRVLVAIDTSGESLLKAQTFCAGKASLHCQRTGHLGSEFYQGETLQKLYDYCGVNPSARVTFLSNHLMPQHLLKNAAEPSAVHARILEITAALVTSACMAKISENSKQCNVCGSELYTLPYIHLAGNMWSADCEYISKLIPPHQLAGKMHEFLIKTLPLRLMGQLKSGLFDDTMQGLGIEGYALDHWVGSHPSMDPCDWRTSAVWHKGLSDVTKLSGWGLDSKKLDSVMKDVEQRRLEFSFLAGLVLKWSALYGEQPPTDSWVYEVYPDGN